MMKLVIEKTKSVRLLILDVDGILTDGVIYYGSDGMQRKGFHIHDGLGIKLLQKSGVQVAVISGKKSAGVEARLAELNIEHAYLGNDNKLPLYAELKQKLNLNDEQIAYMGDDLPDLPLLRRVALAITVPQAPEIIKQYCHYITTTHGGAGAVREACEFIMHAQENYESVIKSYLFDDG
jgi:3-deoxy-D-manno-octulosonate 8-phosphate phosphatase (KDO 8-P phosphatase)